MGVLVPKERIESMAMALPRLLVAIPAHNEAATIGTVVEEVHKACLSCDLVVVDDGSTDDTSECVRRLGVVGLRHATNLGYGRAVQTALKYAQAFGYDAIVTLDGDGQHDPASLPGLLDSFEKYGYDLCIGSRYLMSRSHRGAPLGRRLGMFSFSALTALLTGRQIYDTTSGFKAMRRSIFEPLVRWHFVDFHAEALVYLLRLDYKVGEHPVTMRERAHGQSMHSLLSSFEYPAKTLLLVALGLMQAEIERRRKS
jgi:glycosyltransferase involved in cell wall biosynthesis